MSLRASWIRQTQDSSLSTLSKINRELGKTIIMVTHDPSVARVSTRILRIEDGIIKTALAPSEVIVQEKAVSYVDQILSQNYPR